MRQGNYVYTLNIVIASATVEFGVGIIDHFRKHSSLVNLSLNQTTYLFDVQHEVNRLPSPVFMNMISASYRIFFQSKQEIILRQEHIFLEGEYILLEWENSRASSPSL